MKSLTKIMAIVVCLGVLGTAGYANAGTTTASMDVSAEIVELVSAVTTTSLDFDTIIPAQAGNATLDCSGGFANTLTMDGGTATGTPSPGVVQVTTTGSGTFHVGLTNSTTITTGSPAEVMTLDTISDNSETGYQTEAAAGTYSYYIGGVLRFGASQAAGTYTGTLAVTVTY